MDNKLTIFELEEGKIYKFGNWTTLYKIKNHVLYCKERNDDEFICSSLDYNEVIKQVFTEVEREIDWAKVPRMTKVQVRDSKERMWTNSYFVGYSGYKEGYYPYLATVYIDDEFTGIKRRGMAYKCCRIHPDVEIPEEWYKED